MEALIRLKVGAGTYSLVDVKETKQRMPSLFNTMAPRAVPIEEKRRRKREYARARRLKKKLEAYNQCHQLQAHDSSVRLIDNRTQEPHNSGCEGLPLATLREGGYSEVGSIHHQLETNNQPMATHSASSHIGITDTPNLASALTLFRPRFSPRVALNLNASAGATQRQRPLLPKPDRPQKDLINHAKPEEPARAHLPPYSASQHLQTTFEDAAVPFQLCHPSAARCEEDVPPHRSSSHTPWHHFDVNAGTQPPRHTSSSTSSLTCRLEALSPYPSSVLDSHASSFIRFHMKLKQPLDPGSYETIAFPVSCVSVGFICFI